jgi:L-threonylcarbamoyladenylate synthase
MHNSPALTSDILERAAECLRAGGLAAFPTDTVYGVAALASDPVAVKKLFEAKNRAPDKAIPILLARVEELERVVEHVPEAAVRLARAFWPGALTLVFRRRRDFVSPALAGGETVAVRVPDHPLVQAIIERVREPLAGTSANLSGRPSPVTAEEAREQLGGSLDIIIDGGRCPGGVESTVVDVTADPPRVLREGAILRSELERGTGLKLA